MRVSKITTLLLLWIINVTYSRANALYHEDI